MKYFFLQAVSVGIITEETRMSGVYRLSGHRDIHNYLFGIGPSRVVAPEGRSHNLNEMRTVSSRLCTCRLRTAPASSLQRTIPPLL